MDGTWEFVTPLDGESVPADQANMVFVEVRNLDFSTNSGFTATIVDKGSGSAATPKPTNLGRQGSTNLYAACMSVGQVHAVQTGQSNNTLTVQPIKVGSTMGVPDSIDFEAYRGGSGSGSCSDLLIGAALANRCNFCGTDQPVPVALRLQLDTSVSPGSCADCDQLNQPTTLLHSQDAGFECSWLSQPIDFCSDRANRTLWILQKNDSRTWTLRLRRGSSDVVTYRLTRPEMDCSFPIQLQIAGPGGGECKNWPLTVTISPAL